jgi:drug/metabolite transporter (DMT)-like permease
MVAAHVQKAVGFGILAVASAAFMDALAKMLSESYSTYQIVFFRFAFGVLPLLLMSQFTWCFRELATKRPIAQLTRGCLMFGSAILFFLGLKFLNLAEATAILFAEPIIVLVFAAVFLKESISRRVIISTAIGLLGVIVLLRPGTNLFRTEALFPLGAATLSAIWLILTRSLGKTDTSGTSTIYATLSAATLSVFFLLFSDWTVPSIRDTLVLSGLGFFGCLSTYLYTIACSRVPASTLVVVDYSALLWASIIGFAVWHEVPDIIACAGSLLIVLSGVLAFLTRKSTMLSTT